MGTMTKRIADMQEKRIAYQEKMKTKVIDRVASYLSEEDRCVFLNGSGFVVLPEQERTNLRIDSYPYIR